jgi:hypothetical protein
MNVEQVAEHIQSYADGGAGFAVQAGDRTYRMMGWDTMVQDGGQGSADIVLANLYGTIVGGELAQLNQGQGVFVVEEQADGTRLGVGVVQPN